MPDLPASAELDLGLPAAKPFAIGDRVFITGRRHPWRGRAGVIAASFRQHGLDWTVDLDGGLAQQCCVSKGEIRHV